MPKFNRMHKVVLLLLKFVVETGKKPVCSLFKKQKDNLYYNSVGASGAISAVVFSSIIYNPMSSICLYGILCFPGIVWGLVYLIYEYYMGKKGGTQVNHDAHFMGAIFGILFTVLIRPVSFMEFIEQIISRF